MIQQRHVFPPLPEVGRPESYYARLARKANASSNAYGHDAAKVGQYITLALSLSLEWPAKQRYFQHALSRHCRPPELPEEDVWVFYRGLADMVRRYAGQEALRLASAEDDLYAARLGMGQEREKIEAEAESFFAQLMGVGEGQPDWLNEEDWGQLKLIRDQWI